jgi:hypothetical protein
MDHYIVRINRFHAHNPLQMATDRREQFFVQARRRIHGFVVPRRAAFGSGDDVGEAQRTAGPFAGLSARGFRELNFFALEHFHPAHRHPIV